MARRSLERVDAEARVEFSAQLDVSKQPMPDVTDLQQALEATWVRLFREHGLGKVPASVAKHAEKLDAIGIHNVAAPFQQKYAERYEAWKASVNAAKDRMRELAPDIILVVTEEPMARWPVVHRVSKSTWSTQTQPLHYAKVCATLYAEGIGQFGIPSGVQEDQHDYIVTAAANGLDVAVLQYLPGLPVRQWYRRCLQLGANPCVYTPYDHYGWWSKLGLDNFGNDIKPR